MPPSDSAQWRRLEYGHRSGLPKLLFKFSSASTGYELYVTDLIRIWRHYRTRSQIVDQATENRSSIDPGEDAAQYDILLSKLQGGLSGDAGRCAIARPDPCEDKDRTSFLLNVEIPLPKPLQPLRWSFRMEIQDAAIVTDQLTLPALTAKMGYTAQVHDLERRLKEKDHVIGRLMDKIEQSAIDLSLVFPGFGSGRKGLDAKQATKVVPGIAAFDADLWRKETTLLEQATVESLVEGWRTSGSDRLTIDNKGNWVAQLKDVFDATDRGDSSDEGHGARRAPALPVEESTDAFERPDTQRSKRSPSDTVTKEALSSFPSHAARRASSTSSNESSSQPQAPQSSKLGRLGGTGSWPSKNRRTSGTSGATGSVSDSDSDSRGLSTQARLKKSAKIGTLGGKKKASQSTTSRLSPSPPLPPKSNVSTPSRKVGILGGRKNQMIQSSSPQSPPAQPNTSKLSTPSRKIGVLGGRHKWSTPQRTLTSSETASQRHMYEADDDIDATDSPSPPQSPSPSPSPSTSIQHRSKSQLKKKQYSIVEAPAPKSPELKQEPETAEEIADRKRKELKRTIEAGGGRKKKRKF